MSNESNEKKLSRRRFLKAAAALGVLGAGGAALWHMGLSRLKDFGLPRTAQVIYAERLRQIVAEDNGRGRTIMWDLVVPLENQVLELRLPREDRARTYPVREAFFTDDGLTLYQYAAEPDQLTPGTHYRYRIVAGTAATDWQDLYAPLPDEPYKMLLFPDAQSADYGDWQQLAHLAWARNTDAQLFACMGDLVDNGEDRTQWAAFFRGIEEVMRVIPGAPVMGNHETYNLEWKTRLPEAYLNYFKTPPNGSKEFERYYYSFDYGAVHYIVLCTQQKELVGFKDGLVAEQLSWIHRDLKAHRKRWNVVLMHKDVLQYRIHGRPEREEGIDEENGRVWMPVFDELAIDVVFTAHLHTYRNRGHIYHFTKTPDKKGPLYILTGVAGDVRYPNLWIDHAFDEATLPQPETDNYLTMEVTHDALEIACFLPDGTEMDRVRVTKR